MKKKLIWNVGNYENKNEGLLIDLEDVEEVCNLYDYSVATIDLPVSEKKKLNKLLEEKEAEIYDYCDLEDFLEENGYQNVEIDSLEDYPVCEEKLCFDFQEKNSLIWQNVIQKEFTGIGTVQIGKRFSVITKRKSLYLMITSILMNGMVETL